MVKAESRNALYRVKDLITLKEAKDRYPDIKYIEWVKDEDLGLIESSNHPFYEHEKTFVPVIYQGKYLFESGDE